MTATASSDARRVSTARRVGAGGAVTPGGRSASKLVASAGKRRPRDSLAVNRRAIEHKHEIEENVENADPDVMTVGFFLSLCVSFSSRST